MTIDRHRLAQIEALLDTPRGITTERERDLHNAATDLLAELRRRTPQSGRRIPCHDHPDQPASRCRKCDAETIPAPPNWRNRA